MDQSAAQPRYCRIGSQNMDAGTEGAAQTTSNAGGAGIRGRIDDAKEMAAIGRGIIQAKNITNNFLGELSPSGRIDDLLPQATLNLRDHAQEAELFLDRMEDVIKAELAKAKDEHFVKLSMKLADAATYSSPDNVHQIYRIALGEHADGLETISELKDLLKLLKDGNSLVLLGIPGSGKSTILHHLALLMIGAYRSGDSALLPFFVRLTDYKLTQEGLAPPILKFLYAEAVKLVGEKGFIGRNFKQLTFSNRFCFLLDGLDQMPERRSETIRIRQLKKVEDELRRVDWMLKFARLSGMKKAASRLLGSRREVTTEAAPRIDGRELEMNRLPGALNCVAIASCRQHDFIGVPDWQTLSILPMDTEQVTEFIRCYAPGAEDLITAQAASSDTTRSLITNPFYLKMLTQAAKRGLKEAIHAPDIKKVLSRRGRLLEYLIREAVFNSLKKNQPIDTPTSLKQRSDQILAKLGALAYYMLERNIIGSLPHETLQRIVAEELEQVLRCAEDANLVTIHDGDVGIEFNHQLFLEFLLAFELRKKAAESGQFEEALHLLSQRGDRWAETIRLLFEIVSESDAETLIEKFVKALGAPDTWDISTRVLADLGPRVAPYVAPLLRETEEMKVTGAVKILGKIKARECAKDLVALKAANSWRVRRAAVEALAAMGAKEDASAFDGDRHPAVLRAVFRARLLMDESPIERIKAELTENRAIRSEQMAFAVLDSFSSLLNRQGQGTMLDLIRIMINHNNHDICVLGFLIGGQAPDYVKRVLKPEMLNAALNDDDDFVNVIARRAVLPFLDANDVAQIKKLAPDEPIKLLDPFQRQDKQVLRAYWLLLDLRELSSPSEFLENLCYAPPTEIQLLTRKLGRRGDSTALSFLTFLLGEKRTAPAAVEALAGLEELGVAYLLEALNDPSEQIRVNVSELLQYCRLPRTYSRQLRSNLRKAKIKFHDVTGIQLVPKTPDAPNSRWSAIASIMGFLGFGFLSWVGSKVMGGQTSLRFWFGYGLYGGIPPVTIDPSVSWWVRYLEPLSFKTVGGVRDSDFWLARGRLERGLGRKYEARESLKRSLQLNPDSEVARLELGLMQRSLGNSELAREIVEENGRKYVTSGSDLEALERLIQLEDKDNPKFDPVEQMRLMDRLRLWPELRDAALAFIRNDPAMNYANLLLFRAYRGSQQFRRALAAALVYNKQASQEERIRDIELEDMRWQLRSDAYPAEEIGAFELAIDLGNDSRAYDIVCSLNLLPAVGTPISDEQIYRVQTLPGDIQSEVLALVRRRNEMKMWESILQTMPLQLHPSSERIKQ